jgi:MOSC domain-containing protein
MTPRIADIHRYPVKGLSAESVERVHLSPGQGLPHDRRFAIAHGAVQFDPAAPQWLPKSNFLMLMRDEKLAQLTVAFAPETGLLTIGRAGKTVIQGNATDPVGRALIGQFFAAFMGDAARGAPRLLEAAGHMFSDTREKYVSLINLASVRDLERVVRRPVHPLRFRGNLYLTDTPAWGEFSWVGCEIAIGEARLRVTKLIGRCGATNVDPESAARDMNIPRALQQGFGHVDMGIYAEVLHGGDIATGDTLVIPA